MIAALLIGLGACAFIGLVEWMVKRLSVRRRPTNLGTKVSPRWLNDHEYEKDGDAS